MNVQLSASEFLAVNSKNKLEFSRKDINRQSQDFNDILKNTQSSKKSQSDFTQQAKSVSARNEKYQGKTNVVTGDKKVENTSKDQDTKIPKEEEIIEAIEEKLGISKEKIKEILNELEISAYDLFSQQNLQMFIQKIAGVENSIDLLLVPNIHEIYKDVMNVLNEFKEQYPDLLNMLNQNEILPNINLEDEKFLKHHSPEAETVNENTSQNQNVTVISEGNQTSQTDENFSQQQSEEQPKNKETLTVEVENDSESNKNEQSTGIAAKQNNIEFVENIPINDQGIVLQQNSLSGNQTVNSMVTQLSSTVIDPEQLIDQMVEHIKVHVKEDSTEMNLQLKPDNLGNLSLKIVTERGIITAQFLAESQAVKEIIEANFNHLKDVLQEQGLAIENLEVSVKQDSKEQESNFMQEKSSKSSKRVNEIIATASEDTIDIYEDEYENPYKRSQSEIDFSA